MIRARTVLSNRVLVLENVVFDVSCTKRMHLCVCGLIQRSMQTKSTTTASEECLDRTTWWNQLCWKDVPFRDRLNVACCQERERPSSWPPWGCLAFAIKLEHPTVRRGSLDPIALQGILVGWNRRVPHGNKIATFRDDGEVEEVFTSRTVRTCDTVFRLFGDAGTKSATEAELQEFGESVRARPDEAEGPFSSSPSCRARRR